MPYLRFPGFPNPENAPSVAPPSPEDRALEEVLDRIRQIWPDGHLPEPLSDLLDVTARIHAELSELKRTHRSERQRFHSIFEQAPIGIAHVALDGRFLMVNDQFARITGHSVEALLEFGFQQITHADDLAADLTHVERLLSGVEDRYVLEKRYLRPDGSTVWVNLTVALIHDDAGNPDFFVSVIEDLSEIKKAHAEALRDPLTGLLNRRGFLARAARDMKRAAKSHQAVTLAYLDLDGFKSINDQHGHAEGDGCLIEVARLIEAAVRPSDAVARIGGDEFTLLLPNLSETEAKGLLERLRAGIAALEPAAGAAISCSMGAVSLKPDTHMSVDELLKLADDAMLWGKRAGKDRIRFVSM